MSNYYRHYTDTERNYLMENFLKFKTLDELVKDFNKKFNKNKKASTLKAFCNHQLNLRGHSNVGKFGNGANEKSELPIGTIRKATNGTYIKVKESKNHHISSYAEPYWIPIQKKIWQEYYGEVQKGKMIVFLDCNRENLEIDNLYCIDRKIAAVMSKNQWWTPSKEHTLTAIKWCELWYARKEKEKWRAMISILN